MKLARLLVAVGLIGSLAAPLRAEEGGATPAAAPEPAAGAAEPALVTIPGPVVVTSGSHVPTRRMMLDFFQGECLPLIKVEKGLFSVFSGENPLVTKCLDDLEQFSATYAAENDAAEALSLAAPLYHYRKDYAAEAVTLARVVYLYPGTSWNDKAALGLRKLATAELKEESKVLTALASGPPSGQERGARHLQLLRELAGLQGKAFPALQRSECNRFLQRFPDVVLDEEGLALREESYQREKRFDAYASGLRALAKLYPASPERPKRLLALGETLSRQLKAYDQSLAPYQEIYIAYPQAPEALVAYERSATILAEELKRLPEAVVLLKKIVELYPRTDAARNALKSEAGLLVKMKKPAEAIAAWKELADMFPACDHGVSALVAAAGLARNCTDYEQQIALQDRIIKEYPGREETLQVMFERAQTFEEKLGRREEAIAGYEELINNYAGHALADKARARLERLNKKS